MRWRIEPLLCRAWLQVTGTLLCAVFFVAIVRRAGAISQLSGLMVLIASATLLALVLVEAALLAAVPMAAGAGDTAAVSTSFGYTAIGLGIAFELTGLLAVFTSLGLLIAIALSAGQELWILAAAVTFLRSIPNRAAEIPRD